MAHALTNSYAHLGTRRICRAPTSASGQNPKVRNNPPSRNAESPNSPVREYVKNRGTHRVRAKRRLQRCAGTTPFAYGAPQRGGS